MDILNVFRNVTSVKSENLSSDMNILNSLLSATDSYSDRTRRTNGRAGRCRAQQGYLRAADTRRTPL